MIINNFQTGSQNSFLSSTKFMSGVCSFHTTPRKEMFRRLAGGACCAAGGVYLTKNKIESLIKSGDIGMTVHSREGNVGARIDLNYNNIEASVSYNPKLLKSIEKSSQANVESKQTLQSVIETFDFSIFNGFFYVLAFLGIIIELMVMYAFFYRIYLYGLKGSLQWLDSCIDKAIKTPVTFMHLIFSVFLFVCILSNAHTIGVVSDSNHQLAQFCFKVQDDLLRLSELTAKVAEVMKTK